MKKEFKEKVENAPFTSAAVEGVHGRSGVRPEHFTNIATHENVSLYYENAGIASRYAAFFIDKLVRSVVWIIAALIIYFTYLRNILLGITKVEDPNNFYSKLIMIIVIIYFGIYFVQILYHILFEISMRGRTLGKKAMGITVASVSGEAPTVSQIVVRNVMRFFHLIPGGELADGIVAVCSKKAQRLGDMVAGTMVIKVRKLAGFELSNAEQAADNSTVVQTNIGHGIEEIENAQKEQEDFLEEMKERIRVEAEAAKIASTGEVGLVSSEILSQSGAASEEEAAKEEVKALNDVVPQGGFLTLGETIWLRDYLMKRNQYVARYEYDYKIARILIKKSGAQIPKEMFREKNYEYLMKTYGYHSMLWNSGRGGALNGGNN